MSKYIDPFTDTGFKIIFGKEHSSEEILRCFLNVLFEGDPVLSNTLDEFRRRYSSRIKRPVVLYPKGMKNDGELLCLPVYMTPLL